MACASCQWFFPHVFICVFEVVAGVLVKFRIWLMHMQKKKKKKRWTKVGHQVKLRKQSGKNLKEEGVSQIYRGMGVCMFWCSVKKEKYTICTLYNTHSFRNIYKYLKINGHLVNVYRSRLLWSHLMRLNRRWRLMDRATTLYFLLWTASLICPEHLKLLTGCLRCITSQCFTLVDFKP